MDEGKIQLFNFYILNLRDNDLFKTVMIVVYRMIITYIEVKCPKR